MMTRIPFPELETERLELRKLNKKDADQILKIRSDDEVVKYVEMSKYKSIEDAGNFIVRVENGVQEGKIIFWGITLKETSKVIGTICLWNLDKNMHKAEVGFDLLPHFQGLGIASEALDCVIDYGFHKMQLKIIEGYTNIENKAAIKLLTRKGFEKMDVITEGKMLMGIYWLNESTAI
ncbi:MAG: GNAT family N-acetyltransferase [Bacillota bacterium]|nr:GNAT family N-acetyltransferase [Bacillota bacterium]